MACAREQSCAADDMVDERRYEKARMNANRHASSTAMTLSRALRQREQEVEALSAALRKQQQISQQAHAQLLELSTRRGGAAKGGRSEVEALSLRLAEQETARLAAEARADELQVLPRTRTRTAPARHRGRLPQALISSSPAVASAVAAKPN